MSRQAQPYIISGYHATSQTEAEHVRAPKDTTAQHVGIELEVVTLNTCGRMLEALAIPRVAKQRPIVEQDCSLPWGRGAEIIFPPFTIKQIKNKKSYFARALASIKEEVYEHYDDAGMHYNVNALSTGRASAIFLAFIHNMQDAECLSVFGRRPNVFCQMIRGIDWSIGMYNPIYGNLRYRLGNHSVAVGIRTGGSGANLRRWFEVRLGTGTVKHDEVVLVVDFLNTLRTFAETTDLDGSTSIGVLREEFINYLRRNNRRKINKQLLGVFDNARTNLATTAASTV